MANTSQGQNAHSLSLSEIKNLMLQSCRDVGHGALQHIESRFESRRISAAAAGLLYIDFGQWLEHFLQNLFSPALGITESAAPNQGAKPDERQSSVS